MNGFVAVFMCLEECQRAIQVKRVLEKIDRRARHEAFIQILFGFFLSSYFELSALFSIAKYFMNVWV